MVLKYLERDGRKVKPRRKLLPIKIEYLTQKWSQNFRENTFNINPRLLRQAINRGQKTVMNKKYSLTILRAHNK